MPLHNDELNRRSDATVAQDLSCYIHTGAPGANYLANRVANVNPQTAAAGDWADAAGGDVAFDAHLDFGALHASAAVTVRAWTLLRGAALVADGTFVADVAVPAGRPFRIRSGTIQMNGSST